MSRLVRFITIIAALTVFGTACDLQEYGASNEGDEVPRGLEPPAVGADVTGVERSVDPEPAPAAGNTPTSTTSSPAATTTAAPATTAPPTTAPPTTAPPTTIPPTTEAPTTTTPAPPPAGLAYFNDFSSVDDAARLDQFVAYRDPWVVNNVAGRSDHPSTGPGVLCGAPEDTRSQDRDQPQHHVYQCHPGGDPSKGHQMAFAMDTAGYGWAGALPDQVFTGVTEVSVDVNASSAGTRNFVEIKVIPADSVYANGVPCVFHMPCQDGWDYDDIGAVGASTSALNGTGLAIGTPERPDGYHFDAWNASTLANGDIEFPPCGSGFCEDASVLNSETGIRARFQHILRDNLDGTISFGVERADGTFGWVTAPGAFPTGAVRVMVAFHNYTGTKDGQGPGFQSNASRSEGGFTWHWDDFAVRAASSVASETYFGGTNAERIVVPDGCIAFSQGMRNAPGNTDIAPRFVCGDDTIAGL